MGDFKINEKTVFTQSGSAEPAMGSTITGIPAAGITGVLPSAVTGGSGLTALGTVIAGNLSHADIVYPAGHVVQVKTGVHANSAMTGSQVVLSVDILTTKLNNRVICIADLHGYKSAGGSGVYFHSYITGGNLGDAGSGFEISSGTGYGVGNNIRSSCNKEDIPGAVGTYTYGIYVLLTGTQTFQLRGQLTLLEVQV